jgi:nucleoside-diphosphate-sugar epimerase
MNNIIQEDFKKLEGQYKDILSELGGKTIYITGACGMITTYLNFFLLTLADNYHLNLFLQCRNTEKAKKIYSKYLGKDYLHIVDDNFEMGHMPAIKPDYIIHAASAASTKFFIETPVDVMSPNIVGTWNLLNWAKDINVEKFLFFSSNSIYGEGGVKKDVLEENDYGIVDPLNERSSYIESKRMSEQMCRAFWKQFGVPASIIRICHTYGPTFDIEKDTRIIPRTIKKILNEEDIEIFKDPNSVIQYTYIADMVAAILIVLIKGAFGEAYNSGGDEIVKMDDVISWMLNADESIKSKLIEKEIDSSYNFAKGKGVNFVKLSNEKIKKLGWNPEVTNKEGFTRTVRSYLQDFEKQ